MGYFPNGTSGEMYRERYCDRCLHDRGGDGPMCPIWTLHLERNYKDCNDATAILHRFIPRSADKLDNEACVMFTEDPHADQINLDFGA